jgi:hypothetical protein
MSTCLATQVTTELEGEGLLFQNNSTSDSNGVARKNSHSNNWINSEYGCSGCSDDKSEENG